MNFLEKLQKKPEKIRNRIFWAALIVSVGIIGFFWTKSIGNSLEKLKTEGGEIKKSSEDLVGGIKNDSPMSDIKEGFVRFEEFLKGEEFKELFEEGNQPQGGSNKKEDGFMPNK